MIDWLCFFAIFCSAVFFWITGGMWACGRGGCIVHGKGHIDKRVIEIYEELRKP